MGVRAIIATCIGVLSVTLFTAPAQAAFPGQNGKFVFRTGNDALYTRNSEGSGLTTIHHRRDWRRPRGRRTASGSRRTHFFTTT